MHKFTKYPILAAMFSELMELVLEFDVKPEESAKEPVREEAAPKTEPTLRPKNKKVKPKKTKLKAKKIKGKAKKSKVKAEKTEVKPAKTEAAKASGKPKKLTNAMVVDYAREKIQSGTVRANVFQILAKYSESSIGNASPENLKLIYEDLQKL